MRLKIKRLRWWMIGLIMLGAVINYLSVSSRTNWERVARIDFSSAFRLFTNT